VQLAAGRGATSGRATVAAGKARAAELAAGREATSVCATVAAGKARRAAEQSETHSRGPRANTQPRSRVLSTSLN